MAVHTAHAMNEHFKVPETTAYRAANHQHVPRLGMPGRSAPATAYHGVTLYQPHPDDRLHPWRGLNLYLANDASNADDSVCVVLLELVLFRLAGAVFFFLTSCSATF